MQSEKQYIELYEQCREMIKGHANDVMNSCRDAAFEDFNDWKEDERFRAKRVKGTGNWELKLSEKAIKHGYLHKLSQVRTHQR